MSLQVIRTTFVGQVRALHGFPMPMQVITDQITIRGLMEVESWLAMADQRRAHSLAHTSTYFIDKIQPIWPRTCQVSLKKLQKGATR